VIDDRVLAAVEENLKATLQAHGLGHLPRAEAFAVLDQPDFRQGITVLDYDDLPVPLQRWARLVPRGLFWYWHCDDILSYEICEEYDFPFRVFRLLGYESVQFVWFECDETIRYGCAESSGPKEPEWERFPVVDIVPSLQFRSFCMSHCDENNFPQEVVYKFRPVELLGIDMTGEEFTGYPRCLVACGNHPHPIGDKQYELMRRFYKQIGVPLDYRDVNPGV
jgi:hypothetical protein